MNSPHFRTIAPSLEAQGEGKDTFLLFAAASGQVIIPTETPGEVGLLLEGKDGGKLVIPLGADFGRRLTEGLKHALSLQEQELEEHIPTSQIHPKHTVSFDSESEDSKYDFGKAYQYSKEYLSLAPTLKNPKYQAVAKNFSRNLERVSSMCVVPIDLIHITKRSQIALQLARRKLGLDVHDEQLDGTLKLKGEFSRIFRDDAFLAQMDDVDRAWRDGSRLIDHLTNELRKRPTLEGMPEETRGYFWSGVDAILAAMLINAYEAFEILATDLWETAVNENDSVAMQWFRHRFTKRNENEEVNNSRSGEKFFQLISSGLDLRGMMGTKLLAMKEVRFTNLNSIKNNYSQAFGKSVLDCFEDNSLTSVEKTRHLFVHRSGIVDGKFASEMKDFPIFSELKIGEELRVSGPSIRDAVDICIRAGVSLLRFIDDFPNGLANSNVAP